MKFRFTLLLAGLVAMSGPAEAQLYSSAFGFSTVISDNWIIVSRETVSQNPEPLDFEREDLADIDDSLKSKIRHLAESGRVEMLYYRHSDADFPDNVSFFVSNPEPTDFALVEQSTCNSLQSQIQQAFNRTEFTEVYFCQRGDNPRVDMLIYAFDGAVIGSRSYGYVFNTSAGTVTMTLTCKLSKCEETKSDIERLFLELEVQAALPPATAAP